MFMLKLIFWPFILISKIIKILISLLRRSINIGLGFIFIIIGIVSSITIIGAVIGIPLIILGLGIIMKGIF